MEVELLIVPDCPNEAPARAVLEAAARQSGPIDLQLTITTIKTDEQAQRRGFIGSPTFLINGTDPYREAEAPAGLSCRVYATSHGPSGVPEVATLREALLRARVARSDAAHDR